MMGRLAMLALCAEERSPIVPRGGVGPGGTEGGGVSIAKDDGDDAGFRRPRDFPVRKWETVPQDCFGTKANPWQTVGGR